MQRNILSILLIFSLFGPLQSCKNNEQGAWVNDNINSDIRAQIGQLNKQLFNGIMTGDVNAVKALLSPQIIQKNKKNIDTVVIKSAKSYNAKVYATLDEYYTKSTFKERFDTLRSTKGNVYDYTINFKAVTKEAYASLLISKNLPVNCLIFAVYGKYGDKWKINILQIGQYSIYNKTAPDYYKEAMEQYNNGNLVDAINLMTITSQLANPADNYFAYQTEDIMKTSFNKVLEDANTHYQFPFIINQLPTKPEIFSINPQIIEDVKHRGIFPVIKYKSSITLTDTVALKAENMALQKVIGGIFKGIDKNKSYILYQAYDQIPDNKSVNVKHYGFIQNLKQN